MEKDEKYYCYIIFTTILMYNVYLDVQNIYPDGGFEGAFFWITVLLMYLVISLIALLSGIFDIIIYKKKCSLICHFLYISYFVFTFIYSREVHYAKRYITAKLLYASSYSKCRADAKKNNKLTICFASVSRGEFDLIVIDPTHELTDRSEFWTSSIFNALRDNKFNLPLSKIGPGIKIYHFYDDVYYLYMD
ncbi:MAG: hypothetical protein HQM06_07920 [Magnetococcales bacterium]|nr:hypothetical protein [Magnetococcales bacterium]